MNPDQENHQISAKLRKMIRTNPTLISTEVSFKLGIRQTTALDCIKSLVSCPNTPSVARTKRKIFNGQNFDMFFESCSSQNGTVLGPLRDWRRKNPYRTQPRAAQQRFSVRVWAGILRDYVIRLYLLPSPLGGRAYLILQQVLSELLDAIHVPPHYGSAPCGTVMWSIPIILEFTSKKNTSTSTETSVPSV
ncbi:hypothetical protein TNCV_3910251 [Trichonephila clavipes]|nr:hypothetical protein TNCV_3910251 [Trichonephila clavipes]